MADTQKTIAESKLRGHESLVEQLQKTIQELSMANSSAIPHPQAIDSASMESSKVHQSRVYLLRESICEGIKGAGGENQNSGC